MQNEDYNVYLFEDRLHVIDDVLIQTLTPYKLIPGNESRDKVLADMILRLTTQLVMPTDDYVKLFSSLHPDGCTVKNSDGQLLEFYPFSFIDDEWIKWYTDKYIEET